MAQKETIQLIKHRNGAKFMSHEELKVLFELMKKETPLLIQQIQNGWITFAYLDKAVMYDLFIIDDVIKPEILEFAQHWQ